MFLAFNTRQVSRARNLVLRGKQPTFTGIMLLWRSPFHDSATQNLGRKGRGKPKTRVRKSLESSLAIESEDIRTLGNAHNLKIDYLPERKAIRISPDKPEFTDSYIRSLQHDEIPLFKPRHQGGRPVYVEKIVARELLQSKAIGNDLQQLRLGLSMMKQTQLYNSNLVPLVTPAQLHKLQKKFKTPMEPQVIGFLGVSIKSLSISEINEQFWASNIPVEIGWGKKTTKRNVEIRYSLLQLEAHRKACFKPYLNVARTTKEPLELPLVLMTVEHFPNSNTARISVPGGKRLLGETEVACAVREAKEETGLDFSSHKKKLRLFTPRISGISRKMNFFVFDGTVQGIQGL
jgi:hypothetical protein